MIMKVFGGGDVVQMFLFSYLVFIVPLSYRIKTYNFFIIAIRSYSMFFLLRFIRVSGVRFMRVRNELQMKVMKIRLGRISEIHRNPLR